MVATRRRFLILAMLGIVPSLALARSGWEALAPSEREALAPLVGVWGQMSDVDRQTWIGMVSGFERLLPDEQARIRDRMREWARLTPEQRERARDQYRALRSIPPERRGALQEQWRQYRQLAPEERATVAPSR